MSVITFAAFLMILAAVLAILTDWLFKTLDPWAAEVQQPGLQGKIAQSIVPARSPVLQRSLPRSAAKPAISYQNEIRELPFFC